MLQQFASDIPRYDDFRQVSSFQTNKLGMAIIVNCYKSSAGLDDVVKFYSRTMLDRGWVVSSKEQRTQTIFHSDDLTFRKDDYWLAIKKAERPYDDCDYVVTYYWEHY